MINYLCRELSLNPTPAMPAGLVIASSGDSSTIGLDWDSTTKAHVDWFGNRRGVLQNVEWYWRQLHVAWTAYLPMLKPICAPATTGFAFFADCFQSTKPLPTAIHGAGGKGQVAKI
jgi:hypothetical protein